MKILVAEDDPISRRVLEANLIKWGYDITLAVNGREALDIIRQPDPPSLLISDWMMPQMDGLMLCREIRKLDIKRYIYVILLTTRGEKRDIIQGLEAGADDFLTKPFNQEELKYRIRIGERIINLEHRILTMANTDPLTGIMNRRAFMERLGQETGRAHRHQTQLSFILSDIDHFKQVNDTHGHQTGDLVLQCFSKTLKKSLRPYDFLGRYGGEEFVVGMPETDEAQAQCAAERLRKEVEEMEIILPNDSGLLRITASFGTATCAIKSREEMASFIKRADDALYRAKREGRNRVCQA
ncbi:diguanylate cyclase response regulator [Desulfoluna limicola]|uniref:diguanylate cyclase n=1 Tax=Desulfoluna limicola TaxID=2810562 RepID=A0ABN6F8C7_9BACT|nr:diguanylate cyclase [Desulfoluna limicola]BCS98667.1 diguanylate cyclase response regulator [Desulfoluna limicola]